MVMNWARAARTPARVRLSAMKPSTTTCAAFSTLMPSGVRGLSATIRTFAPSARNVIGFPGVPAYRDWMRTHEGRGWQTVEHTAHVEYQSMLKDLVLESEYVGA